MSAKPMDKKENDEINDAISNLFDGYKCTPWLIDGLLVDWKETAYENDFKKLKAAVDSVLTKKCLELRGKGKFL